MKIYITIPRDYHVGRTCRTDKNATARTKCSYKSKTFMVDARHHSLPKTYCMNVPGCIGISKNEQIKLSVRHVFVKMYIIPSV